MKSNARLPAALYWAAVVWLSLELAPVSAADTACRDAVTTAQMRECAKRRYTQADAELNQVYQQLSARLDPERRRLLRDAQRAWVAFRGKNAAFVASTAEGGTLAPLLEIAERASMTERRIEELKKSMQ